MHMLYGVGTTLLNNMSAHLFFAHGSTPHSGTTIEMKHPLTELFRFALLDNCHGCQPETPDVFRVLVPGCVSDQMGV